MSAARRRWPRACRFARSWITVPTVEQGDRPAALYNEYLQTRAKGRHVLARPGDTLPVAGLDVRFVSAAGDLITKPLPGAGAPNALCRDFKPAAPDPTENARSVGMVLSYGSFRLLDLGDLDVEQGTRSGVPEQPARHRGRVSDDAPRVGPVGPGGPRARGSAARRRDEQRSEEGRHAERVAHHPGLARARRSVAAPLRGGRRRRPQRAGDPSSRTSTTRPRTASASPRSATAASS